MWEAEAAHLLIPAMLVLPAFRSAQKLKALPGPILRRLWVRQNQVCPIQLAPLVMVRSSAQT